MIDSSEIECRYVDGGVAHYEYIMSPRELEGALSAVVSWLQSFEGDGRRNVRIEHERGYEGEDWLYVRWERKLAPEEIAKRERDERERDARYAAVRDAAEKREYERLKAKYD